LFINPMTDDLTRFPDETECLKTQDMYEIVIRIFLSQFHNWDIEINNAVMQ
jgi:hypothetical protein